MNICPRFSNIICLFFVGSNLKCSFRDKKGEKHNMMSQPGYYRQRLTPIRFYWKIVHVQGGRGKEEEEGLIDLCKRKRAFWHARRIPPHTMHCTWCCCIDLSIHFLVLSSLIILGRGETVYWGKGRRRWEYLFFWVVVARRRRLKGGLESLSPDDYFLLSHAN